MGVVASSHKHQSICSAALVSVRVTVVTLVAVGAHAVENIRLRGIPLEVPHLAVCVQWYGLEGTGVDQFTLIVLMENHSFEDNLRVDGRGLEDVLGRLEAIVEAGVGKSDARVNLRHD